MHELTLRIGGSTAEELGDRMTSAEFARWMAYSRIDPYWRVDYQLAVIASLIANANRKRGTRASSPEDFLLIQQIEKSYKTPEQRQQENDEQMKQALKAAFASARAEKH